MNEWDPIGVFDPGDENDESGPVDQYDCIRDPLISHLLRGDSRYEIAEFLRDELTGHFGLESWLVTTNVIDRIFDWWESVKEARHRLITPDPQFWACVLRNRRREVAA